MLKRIGFLTLVMSAGMALIQPTIASAQEYYRHDRDYYAGDHWNGSRWREHRREERRERRWRKHEWKERERAERRYYEHHRYSPYRNYYDGYRYYAPY
jgi:hypothetical protein